MSLEVNTNRNNNRDVTWLVNDNSIEMPLSPSGTESITSSENTSDTSSSDETSVDTNNLEGYIPPIPLSENEVINPYLIGSMQNVLNNCNTSVIPFRDSTNNIVGTITEELHDYDFDCPICLDPLEASHVITMDCCKKQIHLKCINEWHLKNIESSVRDTKDLCIMCRSKSELMSDIYNSITIAVYDDGHEEESVTIYNRRRRRGRFKCSRNMQHLLYSAMFVFLIFLFIFILSGGYLQDDNNRNNTRHH